MGVLTISRKVGSLGDEIGAMVANKLGYRLVTRQEIKEMAQSCDTEFKRTCSLFESELTGGFIERLFFKDPASASLFESLNYELAAQGDVVLMGRGGQIVLAEVPGVFKVRIVAPAWLRAGRISQRANLSPDEAAEFVRKHDGKRRALIESIFDRNLSDWSLYDLVINTTGVSAELATDMICLAMERSAKGDWSAEREKLDNLAFAKRVESHIKKRIATAPHRDIQAFSPQKGVVVLSGVVSEKRSREKAVRLAGEYPGVTQVQDQLKTTEVSF